VLGGARLGRELRLEVAEHAELGVLGVRSVQVVLVTAAPEEGLAAGHVLDVVGHHPTLLKHRVLLLAEVVANRPDDPRLDEEARREGEVHGGAAEHPLAVAEGSLDRVEGDRSNYYEAHGAGTVAGLR